MGIRLRSPLKLILFFNLFSPAAGGGYFFMSIFISGSVAYDTILTFNGAFSDHLLPNSLDRLNLTFQTPVMVKHFGGCAANIAYSLKATGGEPLIVTAVGKDSDNYLTHLKALNIRTDAIKIIADAYTPQAFITTDRLGNQMTAFHEGAMAFADSALPAENEKLQYGIVTPTATHVMKAHTLYLKKRHIPIVWDMGQASAYLTGNDIEWFLDHVDVLTLSSYEWDVLKEKTGRGIAQITSKLQAVIITNGSQGATLYRNADSQHFNAIELSGATYPVGCGDAFRGGLLRGLSLGWDWGDCMRLATVMGAIKAQSPQAQGYPTSKNEIARLFRRAFDKDISL